MNYINGDLIKLALQKKFDVITHGCNCWCNMGSGIAVPMSKTFDCNIFPKENQLEYAGDYNKLGTIDYIYFSIEDGVPHHIHKNNSDYAHRLIVVNSYTQFSPGRATPPYDVPLDYDALRMCFRKINFEFPNKHLGIPQIGCGLAGGEWDKVGSIIEEETTDMKVTCVIYDK